MSQTEPAIRIRGVSKKFRLHQDRPRTLKERFLQVGKSSSADFWALREINLDVLKGRTVGLIGRNGSGKSTLLKIMSRILYPETGTVSVSGRVSCLLELGAGFHPDFTGRENIYTNAAIFGLSRREVRSKIGDIVRFAELENFVDSPVRTYSSGMYMRLAFAVAIHIEPTLLLVDEILAVGDENFQHKCIDKLKSFKNQGITTVIVTHNLKTIREFCDEVHWLESGSLQMGGTVDSVVDGYLYFMKTLENGHRQLGNDPLPAPIRQSGTERNTQ